MSERTNPLGPARKASVVVVDDDPVQVQLLTRTLEKSGRFATRSTQDPRHALESALDEEPDAVITDILMPGMSGLELTERLRLEYPTLPILVLTSLTGEDSASAAFKAGATDFITKPMDPADIRARLDRALENVPKEEIVRKALVEQRATAGILGAHPRIAEVRDTVRQVAAVPNVPALILGESGTGKNLVARAIHASSPQARHRLVEVNCAALPENLLEAEIFGYEKGAFTDARKSKKGLAEVADGGTLFLDEIGSLAPGLQAKLLTFLESRSFRRVGGTDDIHVNLRIVAATNENLEGAVESGRFREDLYYRLNVARIELPPLREIRQDVGALASHFLERAAEYFAKPLPRLTAESIRRLEAYDWPGNARELRNVIERALIFSKGETLRVDPFVPEARRVSPGAESAGTPARPAEGMALPLGLRLDEVEKRYIEATLEAAGGSVNAAAERLGVTRKVLWSRRRKHGLL
ncbi:MAG: sigma-54 dependent transcriptional regulator [Gemmatimonadota bacterium]